MLKPKIILLLLALLLSISFITACDHTNLTGEISIINNDSEYITLILEVPDELEDIHDVMWTVNPINMGKIYSDDMLFESFSIGEIKELFGDKSSLPRDRMAVFAPAKSGKVKIEADGFYLQTNPQPITALEIDITK